MADFICGGTPMPAAQRELDDYRVWLGLPKPRPEFHAWRTIHALKVALAASVPTTLTRRGA